MSSIDILFEAKPDWVDVLARKRRVLEVKAHSQKDSGAPGELYFISIETVGADSIKAFETSAHRRLPKCCIERHINDDTSFCLYLNSTRPVFSEQDAWSWWAMLGRYLSNQDFASKHGLWPRDQGLSHGSAANTQIRMEEIAEPLGWKSEVLDSIFRSRGFLYERPLRQHKDKEKGFVNLRNPCPRGCKKLHFPHRNQECKGATCEEICNKSHKAILRASCPNREVIEQLNRLEILRKSQEEQLVKTLLKKGTRCCGSMRNCPLAS
ncbi:E2 domain-containing protein [Falsihalocynthiibacter arcticus]|uniref:Prokaryotic E2 domain-containing protein n=1 Tax=Falsihalocynthiibacter arcticus TaxID=1579316 RepID=A0A126V6B5_9RHOB|nr:hypothetical protein RC74_21445 [Falsihalocynthiibacter arcticus]